MAIDLKKPLRWKTATIDEQKMLKNLQGNILKGHGRDHTWNIFFQLGTDQTASKRALREIGNFHVTDAYTQLLANEAFKSAQVDGGTFCAAFLSAAGYTSLGLSFTPPASNTAFVEGMKHPTPPNDLADPATGSWEAPFQKDIHGMLLVADDNQGRGSGAVFALQELLIDAGGMIVHIQAGKAIRNAAGEGLEHFGYVDGRSQPLLLMEDVEKESQAGGIARWDPSFPLNAALVPDPLGKDASAFGSFFIFRKLEEKVADFKLREQLLADQLLLTDDDRELAGALVVGRFEDGTPVTTSDEAKSLAPPNDFNYAADDAGSRCPFHAHIRKANPRTSSSTSLGERAHIMPRRGITYEDVPRLVHPDGLPESSSLAEFTAKVLPLLPTGGLGLLFMAYNSRLDEQFVFTQKQWVNNLDFPKTKTGIDGVLGQGPNIPGGQLYSKEWDNPGAGTKPFDFKGFVLMQGGEYFFAPSVLFLRSL